MIDRDSFGSQNDVSRKNYSISAVRNWGRDVEKYINNLNRYLLVELYYKLQYS